MSEDWNRATPKPIASPVPPEAAEGDTNPGIQVDVGYLKQKLEQVRHAARAEVHEEFKAKGRRDWLRDIVIAIGAVAAAVVAAIIFVDNRVAAQTDAGVRVEHETLKAQDARLTTLEKRFDRYDAKQDRQTELIEAVADQLRVPESRRPAPVPPLDGGR